MRLAPLLLLALSAAAPAQAADMPARGRIATIFAEPVAVEPPPPNREWVLTGVPIYAPEVDIPPLVHGYYGKPNSYYYRNYYGTSPIAIFTRLPYACGWHGYC